MGGGGSKKEGNDVLSANPRIEGTDMNFTIRRVIPGDYPVIVTLCGSTRFWRTFQEASLRETLAGRVVLSIGAASGTDDEHFGGLPEEEHNRVKEMLDALHMRKLELCDEALILNVLQPWCAICRTHCFEMNGRSRCCDWPIEQRGYIGSSTSRELAYARSLGKAVRFWEGAGDATDNH